MAQLKRLGWALLVVVLIASPVVPAWSVAVAAPQTATFSDTVTGDFSTDPVRALRHRVTAEELQTQYDLTAAWLHEWMMTREVRPPVDLVHQTQTVAEWTVLVYVAADNNLELAGLSDINEMEAVGSSPQVNILAQIDRSADYVDYDGDWTETRRYYIQQDQEPQLITSPVAQNLGEIDTGSADAVADFAIWGITNYPAKKYMLVFWDHGGAWISHSSDEDTGNDITLPDTVAALERIKAETGIDQFEVIGFDMCIMGQLEVFEAIAPYARYGIGSEENEPGAGWFYVWLDELVRNPAMDGAQVGRHVVDSFMYFLREVVGDEDVYGLGTVDFSQSASLISALNRFADTIEANPQAALSPIADARNNTIQYGGFNDPQVQDFWSSIDLYRFMEVLSDLTQSPEVKQAAGDVMQAIKTFVIYEDHVEALDGSHGVAIYFPRSRKAYKLNANNERYPREAPQTMARWIEFLDVFHGTATATVTEAPGVNIVNVYPDVASIHQPAIVTLEVSGRDILRVSYAVTRIISESERVVLDFDYLVSRTTTPGGSTIIDWSDGVTQRTFTWEAEVPMLSDGTTNTFALLIPNVDNPHMALVNGLYTSKQGGEPIEAQLLFDLRTRQSTAIWGLNQTASGNLQPFELTVENGDMFQPLWLTLDANNELAGTSFGETLTLMNAQSITFAKVPAPSGRYAISFVAENVSGTNNLSEAIIQINNDGLDPALRGYTDLIYGVNFLYPANWLRPRFTPDGQRLFTGDEATGTVLSLFPYTDVSSAEETDAAIRASWNQLQDLEIQRQRPVDINGLPAYVTDYTYTFNGAGRVGVVIAIFVPSQGVGYAFDLDAPAENPAPAQQGLQALVNSINFFDPETVLGTASWQTVTPGEGLVSFPVPANWTPEETEGWTLYRPVGNDTVFVGLGTASASGQTNEQLVQFWVEQLETSVSNFQVLASEPFYIANREWHVVVFAYDADVRIAGAFFTTTSVGGYDYVFWIEAPDADFDQLYADVFSVIIGGFTFNG